MIREGYRPWGWPSPMVDRLGSLQSHANDPSRFGFEVDEPKLNGRALLHAGAVSTVADIVIGHSLAPRMSPPARFVTIGLEMHFIGAAHRGDWIDVVVTPVKLGSRLAVGTALFTNGDHRVSFATATFMPA